MILLLLLLTVRASSQQDLIDNSVNFPTTDKNSIKNSNNDNNIEAVARGVVETEYGTVRGFQRSSGIWDYFDIPYGEFNSENPFQEAGSPEKWSYIHEPTQHRSHCPQILESGEYSASENCLTLSIFTPAEPNNNDVLFHIHDGSFSTGSGDPSEYGPEYLVPKGVVLVLPNYRLGPLGFLCSLSDIAPGNSGLKDLTLALNWTKNNIGKFGGNASNIVVSGSGDAAALVEYLILSEKSKHLINRAITESGSLLSHWAFDRDPTATVALLEENLKSDRRRSQAHQNSLTDVSLEVLIEASKGIKFRPCKENSSSNFINDTPAGLLRDLKLDISYMSGSANHAGMQEALQYSEEALSELNKNYALLLPDDLKFENDETMKERAMQVKKQYFCNDDITLDNIERLSLCYTDCSYLNPGIRTARSLVEGGAKVFFYEFSFVNSQDLLRKSRLGQSLKYVFSREEKFETDSEDYKMMTTMTNLWVSFIKTGEPKLDGIEWKELSIGAAAEENWLSIGREIKLKQGLHHDRLELWDEIYRKYYFERNTSNVLKPALCMSVIVVLIIDISKNMIPIH